jgi:hypothetical protein
MIQFGTAMPIHRQIEDWAIEKTMFGKWYMKAIGYIVIAPFCLVTVLYGFLIVLPYLICRLVSQMLTEKE